MNIQTERLEDQTARVTVEIDAERLDAAKQKAAQQISRRVNIPGFRKGKAPYRILLNYVGEPAILEDAVELLSQEVYMEVLPQTDLDPYGPGTLTDVKSDLATPTFVYVVPLQPSIDLKDYRSVRLPYETPEVTDDAVNRSMKNLQEQQAVVEPSSQPAVLGNRVTLDLHSYILGEHVEPEAAAEADDADADEEQHEHDHDEHDHDHEHGHSHGDEDEGTPYLHEHDLQLLLDEDDEPQPGFSEALVGVYVGDSRSFELTFPDDAEEYEDMAGKTVKYYVDVKKVETLTMPELTDEFAARVTKDEEKPLTLLELRMRVRENMTSMSEQSYRSEYVRKALDEVVEQAEIKFPEAMVADQVDSFLRDFDQRLRQQGITLQDYMKIYQKTAEDLYNDYKESAEQSVRRSLALREIADAEQLEVTDERVEQEIDRIVGQFDEERRGAIRQMFEAQPNMRDSVRNDLMRDVVLERVAAIARGEAPTITASEEAPALEAATPEALAAETAAAEDAMEQKAAEAQAQDEVTETVSEDKEESN
ncbi:MAG: trigger factor [Anaerolineae bacterium]|nr:trigger factor [Anaerolineae bacterium]